MSLRTVPSIAPLRRLRAMSTLLALSWLLPGCATEHPVLEVDSRILAPALRECSGIVPSRQHAGVFWAHNDSGNAPELFAITAQGSLLCTVQVQGSHNIDWEDITTDDAGLLYVGEFGNNRNMRTDLEVLVLQEPDPDACEDGTQSVMVQRHIPFRFPEQKAFPDPEHMNFDVEALFWHEGSLYVFTKHRSDTWSVLYRLPTGESTDAERLGAFDAQGMVTAATTSRDGRKLLVLTYDALFEFTLRPGRPFLEGPPRRMWIEGRQCEAVCYDGDDILVLNEQREIYRIRPGQWGDVLLPEAPRARVALVDTPPEEVDWHSMPLQSLQPEYQEGLPPTSAPPVLQLGRSRQALLLRVDYGSGLPDETEGLMAIVHVGSDEARQARQARPDDSTFDVVRSHTHWHVNRIKPADGDEPSAAGPADGRILTLRLPVPEALAGDRRAWRVNVILRRPGTEGAAEWAWGATSSARPEENVLLWGRLEVRKGR